MPRLGRDAVRRAALPALVVFCACYPLWPGLDAALDALLDLPLQLDRQLLSMFIFALFALGVHLQVGTAGLMQLGGAAFFALGAYAAGVATVQKFPFQLGFWWALALAPGVGAVAGTVLGGLCARVRGDQLAMVTLGFGEVVRVVLLNLESITDGSRGLNPLPAPTLPASAQALLGGPGSERAAFVPVYAAALAALCATYVALGWLSRVPLGRALVALREDALAVAAVGHAPAALKCVAMGLGGAICALAGALYAGYLTTTAEPNTYDANLSYMVLCSVILGGLHSRLGVVLGAGLLVTFDNVVTPLVGQAVARLVSPTALASTWANFANWRWLIFGGALVLTMRLRPEGLLAAALPRPQRGRSAAGAGGTGQAAQAAPTASATSAGEAP